jgi:hypothetical protein
MPRTLSLLPLRAPLQFAQRPLLTPFRPWAFKDFLQEFPCSHFILRVNEFFGCPQLLGILTVRNSTFLERQASTNPLFSSDQTSRSQPFLAASSSP